MVDKERIVKNIAISFGFKFSYAKKGPRLQTAIPMATLAKVVPYIINIKSANSQIL